MKMKLFVMTVGIAVLFAMTRPASALERYVTTNGSDAVGGTSWDDA